MSHTTEEIWLPVPGWEERYRVSSLGRLRSLKREGESYGRTGVVHKGTVTGSGHVRVLLRRPGQRQSVGLHRLVLEAFVGPCPDGYEALHSNGVASDNRVQNLRWGTRSANVRDAVRHGTHHNTAKTKCVNGHNLTQPNLTKWSIDHGVRNCLACARARASLQKRPGILQERADEKYVQIMSKVVDRAWTE